jgi:hypothetical protein
LLVKILELALSTAQNEALKSFVRSHRPRTDR